MALFILYSFMKAIDSINLNLLKSKLTIGKIDLLLRKLMLNFDFYYCSAAFTVKIIGRQNMREPAPIVLNDPAAYQASI